ncbi:hypothetical protein BZG36_00601 [Bifiguratus adelaidae]|uniref:Amidohydrolase-related domain-containing protein n=1 Tax=Bifiguratus adelaidae TaxID=1938954 RepID=A0A261Y7J7_9FUNG|nr:hypothetical protein BZG36_00601 [Bifiguratus adelaidae]
MLPPLVTLEEHYVSKAFREANPAGLGLGLFPPDTDSKLDDLGEVRLREMDAGSISLQVVSHNAAAPVSTPDFDFVGALICNHANGVFYDGKAYDPFWERAQELDVPIYIHPSAAPKEMMSHYQGEYDAETANVLSTYGWRWHSDPGLHVLRLYASGVFDRFPRLKIIIGHMGEMLPFMHDRVLDFETHLGPRKRGWTTVWDENIWITTSGTFTVAPLACALQNTKKGRILYSVDYPFSSNLEGKRFMEEVQKSSIVTEEELEMIAYRNAEKLLGVRVAAFPAFTLKTVKWRISRIRVPAQLSQFPSWRIIFFPIWINIVSLPVRSAYRFEEFSQGFLGDIQVHETYFYAFDTLYIEIPPGRYLQPNHESAPEYPMQDELVQGTSGYKVVTSGGGNDKASLETEHVETRYAKAKCNPAALSIVALEIFLLSAIAMSYQSYRYRTLYMFAGVAGGLGEATGYALRLWSGQPDMVDNVGAYAASTLFLLLPPIVIALTSYLTVARITSGAEYHSKFINSAVLEKAFVIIDVICFLVQAAGGGMMAIASVADIGSNIALAGLAIALASLLTFAGITLYVQRSQQFQHLEFVPSKATIRLFGYEFRGITVSNWRVIFIPVWINIVTLLIRAAYRLAEFSQGFLGYIQVHEVYFYVFDALMMVIAIAAYIIIPPGRYLQLNNALSPAYPLQEELGKDLSSDLAIQQGSD